jgi:MFS family permease
MWVASVLSAIGTFFQSVAASWLMLELTGSNTWVGLMIASSTLPLLFLALFTGTLADMFERTRLMLIAQLIMGGSATAMAILVATERITPGLLLGLGFLLGIGVAINLPTWQALLPDLVPRGLVASAVALQSAAFNTARAVGPAMAGALVAAAGAAIAFGINAFTYLIAIAGLLVVRRDLEAPERQVTSFSSAIALGIRFTRFTPEFGRLLVFTSLFAITSAVVQSVLPSHTTTFDGEAGLYGILLGFMGVGALVGAFTRARVMAMLGTKATTATVVAFGSAGILLGLAPNPVVASVAMLLAGYAWLMTLTDLRAIAQLISPAWIRGRTMAMYTLAFSGILPIGAILAGVVADWVGTSSAIVAFSACTIFLGVAAPVFRIPRLDEIETPEFSESDYGPHQDDFTIGGGPVVILNHWEIDESDFEEFTRLMTQIRRVRLRTGAYRWRLFRDSRDPHRLVEFFVTGSWEEHLAQHRRIDDYSRVLLSSARAFDRSGGPTTRHLIAIDVEDPPDYDQLIVAHEEMHRSDGSIPTFYSEA